MAAIFLCRIFLVSVVINGAFMMILPVTTVVEATKMVVQHDGSARPRFSDEEMVQRSLVLENLHLGKAGPVVLFPRGKDFKGV